MSQILNANKFEFVDGSRLGSIQILYRNYLYNKHKVKSWKCKEKGCNSTINVDEEFLTVTREPSQHKDHPELTSCRIAVLKAMNKMKIAVKDESTVGLKVIYERYKQSLTDQKFSLSDITSINDGKFPTFSEVTNTLKNIRGTIVPIFSFKESVHI